MAQFVPGLRLAGEFYTEVVQPVLEPAYPGIVYSAALLGWGSEILGFDSPRSTDHNWGPRLQLFLAANSGADTAEVTATIAARLPATFRGHPIVFPSSEDPDRAPGHWVEVTHLSSWLENQLGFDPILRVSLLDWLATPTQRLAEVTAGAVFHDGSGDLTRARERLAWYPHDVWLHVLACQWQRIAQGGSLPRPVQRSRRRTGIGHRHRPADSRHHAAVSVDGPPLSALQQMARLRLQPAS